MIRRTLPYYDHHHRSLDILSILTLDAGEARVYFDSTWSYSVLRPRCTRTYYVQLFFKTTYPSFLSLGRRAFEIPVITAACSVLKVDKKKYFQASKTLLKPCYSTLRPGTNQTRCILVTVPLQNNGLFTHQMVWKRGIYTSQFWLCAMSSLIMRVRGSASLSSIPPPPLLQV